MTSTQSISGLYILDQAAKYHKHYISSAPWLSETILYL